MAALDIAPADVWPGPPPRQRGHALDRAGIALDVVGGVAAAAGTMRLVLSGRWLIASVGLSAPDKRRTLWPSPGSAASSSSPDDQQQPFLTGEKQGKIADAIQYEESFLDEKRAKLRQGEIDQPQGRLLRPREQARGHAGLPVLAAAPASGAEYLQERLAGWSSEHSPWPSYPLTYYCRRNRWKSSFM